MTPDSAGRVIAVGSVNIDLVARVTRLPERGETVTGGTFERHDGGKGANQAVAAARLGAAVEFVGAVGDDDFGRDALAALRREGIGLDHVAVLPGVPTGVALILVEAGGENEIAVAPGANAAVDDRRVTQAMASLAVHAHDVVLVSHEIPTAAARAALSSARRAGATTIFNPAPSGGLDRGTFGLADILTPNRGELATLAEVEGRRTGRSALGDGPERQARRLLEASAEGPGPRVAVLVTLGALGALLVVREATSLREVSIPAAALQPVDSTGAGDTFNGALAAGLLEGRGLEAAVRRAVIAAGIATTRVGAREGMPTAAALDAATAASKVTGGAA